MGSEKGSGKDDKQQKDAALKPSKPKGYKDYLSYLKDSKNSEISAWIGKSSDIFPEILKYAKDRPEGEEGDDQGIIAPQSVVNQGALKKALEITMLDFVKAKLESEDPVELGQKYGTRLARLNDEYHHQKILYASVMIIGFIKDKDTKVDRLLVTRKEEKPNDDVYVVDPESGVVVEVLQAQAVNSFMSLIRNS